MSMVRPAALELLDEPDELEALELLEEVAEGVVEEEVELPVPASSPELPHAARPRVSGRARASPTAYPRGARSVIFVTNPSLDSAF
jgi:hypothetical protein